jgi:hypothetical protein
MASVKIPDSFASLITIANGFVQGLSNLQGQIGVTQNTDVALQKDIDTAQARFNAHETLRKRRSAKLQPAVTKADAEGRKFIDRSKKVLAVKLGNQWNEFWAAAGFGDETIQTPEQIGGREKLLKDLASYFASHPAHESADLVVNAALATKLHANLSKARTALETLGTRQKAARTARDKSIEALRKRIRATIAEIDMRIERDSHLWSNFGVAAPAEKIRRRKARLSQETTPPPAAPAPEATPAPTAETAPADRASAPHGVEIALKM